MTGNALTGISRYSRFNSGFFETFTEENISRQAVGEGEIFPEIIKEYIVKCNDISATCVRSRGSILKMSEIKIVFLNMCGYICNEPHKTRGVFFIRKDVGSRNKWQFFIKVCSILCTGI